MEKTNEQNCEFCTYKWMPRVSSPKSCPRCKRRFDYKDIRDVYTQLKKEILGIDGGRQLFEVEA